MARGAFWRVAAPVLASAWLMTPPAVTRADEAQDKAQEKAREKAREREIREPVIRALRMAGGGVHLGVSLADIGGEERARLKLADERGALVKQVHADTPAARAGLKADDVIVRFDGETVRSAAQLSRLVRETPPGRPVAIEVSRDGTTQRLTATLEESDGFALAGEPGDFRMELPPMPPEAPFPPMLPLEPLVREGIDRARRGFFVERPGRLGITYQELSGQLARYFKVADGSLLVSEVDEGSPAAKAGLKAGDVIVQVGGQAVSRAQELRERVARAEAGTQIALGVQRDGKPLDVTVTIAPRTRANRGPAI